MTTTADRPGELPLGVQPVTADGARLQCRECGRWLRSLIGHLHAKHGMDADTYRERWGLGRTYPLVGAATRARLAEAGRWRRDHDPRVLAALHGPGAQAQRHRDRRGRPAPTRASAGRRRAEVRRNVGRHHLAEGLARLGVAELAGAVDLAAAQGWGWARLARELGVARSYLQQLARQQDLTLTARNDRVEAMLAAAQAYAVSRGHLGVPAGWIDERGRRLGRWLTVQRSLARRRQDASRSCVEQALDRLDPRWRGYGRGPNAHARSGRSGQ